MELFLPKLLSLPSIQAVIATSPPGSPEEIFVTREKALENDSLYQSCSFKFQLGEEEKDRNAIAVTSSPSSDLTSNNSLLARPQHSESPTHLDGDLVSTSHDEWSVDSPLLIPISAEYRTPLLTTTPLANTFAFNHPCTQSTHTMPNRDRDFMIPAPHFHTDHTSATQSYFPEFSKYPLDKDIGISLGADQIVMRPNDMQYRTLADDFLEQGYGQEKDFAPRRHSLDSPTGIFGSAFFRSPPRMGEQQAADSWQERDLLSSFRSNGFHDESRGYPGLHDQMDAEQILPSGRRTKLIPQNAMQSQHYNQQQQRQQQQHDEFTFARRLSESRGFPSVQNSRPEKGFKSENFTALKQYHQDRGEFEAQQLSLNQRLRDSRYTMGQGQGQGQIQLDDYGRIPNNYPVQPTLERSRSLNIISEPSYQPNLMPPSYNSSLYPDYASNDSMRPALGSIGRNSISQKKGSLDVVNDAGQRSPFR
jgi:hypothetical protein